MQIIVCGKQVVHTHTRTGMDPSDDFIAAEDRVVRTNPYDEAALEQAVRLKEKLGGVHIRVLTLGPLLSEAELTRFLALGADDCLHVNCSGDLDPWVKSLILAKGIRAGGGGDLILFGKESLDRGNAQVGSFCAHHLRLPYLGPLLEADVDAGKERLRGVRRGQRGTRQILSCDLPAVAGMDWGGVEVRFPSYEDRRAAQRIPIRRLEMVDGTWTPRTRCTRVFPPRPRPRAVPTPDSRLPAEKRIEFLLRGSRVEKKGEVLTGDPETVVDGVILYLQKEGFLGG